MVRSSVVVNIGVGVGVGVMEAVVGEGRGGTVSV